MIIPARRPAPSANQSRARERTEKGRKRKKGEEGWRWSRPSYIKCLWDAAGSEGELIAEPTGRLGPQSCHHVCRKHQPGPARKENVHGSESVSIHQSRREKTKHPILGSSPQQQSSPRQQSKRGHDSGEQLFHTPPPAVTRSDDIIIIS